MMGHASKKVNRMLSNKQLGKTVSEGFLSPVTGVSPPPQDLPDLDLSLGGAAPGDPSGSNPIWSCVSCLCAYVF